MANRVQQTLNDPGGSQTVIGNAPHGPREFDPGQWGQIAIEKKMEKHVLHENFKNVRSELKEKYGYQINDSGLIEGRTRPLDDKGEVRTEDFPRPKINLKSRRNGEIKTWTVAVPLVEDMPHRDNFPRFIGHLSSVQEVFRLFIDYQNWFNHIRNQHKRSKRALVPGSAEYARAKAKEMSQKTQVKNSFNKTNQVSSANLAAHGLAASGLAASSPAASGFTASGLAALQKTHWVWPDHVEKVPIPDENLLNMEENLELKAKLDSMDPKYLHVPSLISVAKDSNQNDLIIIWKNFFQTKETNAAEFQKIEVEAELTKDRFMSRYPQSCAQKQTSTESQTFSTKVANPSQTYSSVTTGSNPNLNRAAGRPLRGSPVSTLDMGAIPVALGAPNQKRSKELTITCRLKRPDPKAPRPEWTHGTWVATYQDIIKEALNSEGFENFVDPTLVETQYLNRYKEALIVTSTKEGLQWLLKLINSKFPQIETIVWKPPPPVWSALALNIGSLPIEEGEGKGSAVELLKDVLKLHQIQNLKK